MKTIHAIYENGVFKPTEPVDLPNNSRVKIEPDEVQDELKATPDSDEGLGRIYAILSERCASGDRFGSERHNEHQP